MAKVFTQPFFGAVYTYNLYGLYKGVLPGVGGGGDDIRDGAFMFSFSREKVLQNDGEHIKHVCENAVWSFTLRASVFVFVFF